MNFEPQMIRSQTKLALPDDDSYLYRLGTALYGFTSINGFMVEVITHLDPFANRTDLLGLMSGEVLDRFRYSAKRWSGPDVSRPAKRAAQEFERLNTERSDFVHAYPITSPSGDQILHRRVDTKGKYFEVTNQFLDNFLSRLESVSTDLYEVRTIVSANI